MIRAARYLSVACALLLAPAAAHAQAYPSRPITIVVPAAPGGVTDMLGRILAKRLTEAWGQQAIVENKPGANNQIAAELVARAAPDGNTLFVGPETTFVVNPSIYAKLNYDPVKDFTPITGLITINQALLVTPSLPVGSVKELIALARQKPGALNYGTFGIGSSSHLNMELFAGAAGVRLTPVHYKGATPALTDVMAGHIQFMFSDVPPALPLIVGGKLRALGVTTDKRNAALPDVPTVADTVPGYEASAWFGIGAPKNTPPEISAKLNKAVNDALADPKMKAKLADLGGIPMPGSPADFGKVMADETAKWEKVVKFSGASID